MAQERSTQEEATQARMAAAAQSVATSAATADDLRRGDARRAILMFGVLIALVAVVFVKLSPAYGLRVLAEAGCFAIIALGLTIQWGYAGVFNAGVMGFIAIGGFMLVFISAPIDPVFWSGEGPGLLGSVLLRGALTGLWLWGGLRLARGRSGAGASALRWATAIGGLIGLFMTLGALDVAADAIERGGASSNGFIGGLGLPPLIAWLAGGAAAAAIAWGVGRACLGLRSDYLAIATLGVAEIIKTVLKNSDWLTRGTLTVSPLPWPTPTPNEVGFELARAGHLALTAVIIALLFWALQRAYASPWGRMIRAIRDNETAAAAMGKDVDGRRLEIFVLGAAMIGLGGAALVGFNRIFDPSGFWPLNHTFLVWLMVILGGSGNNLGALFGSVFVYLLWTLSEPLAVLVFETGAGWAESLLGWSAPADLQARALQSRVLVIGVAIVLVLRLAPSGLLPERPPKQV